MAHPEPAHPAQTLAMGHYLHELRDFNGLPEFARPKPPCAPPPLPLFPRHDAARPPAPPHRRLRQPGHPADRPPPARVAHLLRDPPLPEGRRRLPRRLPPAGGHPLRRPGQRHRARQPARRPRDLHPRRPGSRRLLRPADHDGPARRPGRGRPPRRVRPRLGQPHRHPRPALHRPVPDRPRGGLDEPRRPRHRARPRLRGDRRLAQRPVRDHRRPRPPLLRRPVPPRGAPHRQRRPHPPQLHRPRRLHRRLDHGRLQGPGDRRHPRPGRRRPRHLRPLRRRRLARWPRC